MRMADGGRLGVISRSIRSSVGVSEQAVVALLIGGDGGAFVVLVVLAVVGGAFVGGGDVDGS